jgi:hypothetical protein
MQKADINQSKASVFALLRRDKERLKAKMLKN